MKKGELSKPKFSKVDDHTIEITVARIDEVPLGMIIANKEQIIAQKKKLIDEHNTKMNQIDQTLKNIDDILEQAKKLGITPAQPKPPKKKEDKK